MEIDGDHSLILMVVLQSHRTVVWSGFQEDYPLVYRDGEMADWQLPSVVWGENSLYSCEFSISLRLLQNLKRGPSSGTVVVQLYPHVHMNKVLGLCSGDSASMPGVNPPSPPACPFPIGMPARVGHGIKILSRMLFQLPCPPNKLFFFFQLKRSLFIYFKVCYKGRATVGSGGRWEGRENDHVAVLFPSLRFGILSTNALMFLKSPGPGFKAHS